MARRPTILQIIPRLDTGGAELSAIEIVDAIVRGGGRAIVVTEGGRMSDHITARGGELVIMPAGTKNPLKMWANVRALKRLIAIEDVDLVHARSRAPAWSALSASRSAAKPFVTTYHGAYAENGTIKRFYNSVMVRSDIVIANSRYTADLVQGRYGTPETRIRVIHRGIDGEAFDPLMIAADRLGSLRQRFGLEDGQRMILQMARLTSWKGQRVLIEAAHRLDRSGRLGNAVVILAGDSQGRNDYETILEADIKRYGLERSVRLVGHIDDVAAALALAYVAVVASTKPEAFGRSVTEAAAIGCPAIATNLGAPPETVRDAANIGINEATGWLVAPGDAAALTEALATILALSDTERDRIGRNARAHALEHFSLFAMKRATLCVYDEVLGSSLAATFERNSSSAKSVAGA